MAEKLIPELHTPLVQVEGVWVKLEYQNPSGSVKDRVARHVLTEALRSGRLREGSEAVEPTSGNAGIALAFWASKLGLQAVAFLPENMTEERHAAATPHCLLFDQFEDQAGVEAQVQLGRELHRQARAVGIYKFDAVVAGVGTGGTLIGAGGFLKEQNPTTRLIAVEPDASPLICQQLFSRVCPPPVGPPLFDIPAAVCHLQEGIGDGLVPGIIRRHRHLLDDVALVSDGEALEETRQLNQSGYPVGPSSGTNLIVARRFAREGLAVVTFFPDRIDRYRSLPEFRSL